MEIYDFINEDELGSVPDDPSQAFSLLVQFAMRRLAQETQQHSDDEYGRSQVSDARHTFQNYVIGLAKAYAIEPFASMDVPDHSNFGYKEERRFKTELDHYMTQLIVGNSLRMRKDTVGIPPKLKEQFSTHLTGLRECIDKADLTNDRKAALKKKLDDFEEGLSSRQRVNLFALSRLIFEIMSVTANGLAFYDSATVRKLASSLLADAAEAKVHEEQQRQLPPSEAMPRLSPPTLRVQPSGPRESFSADLDDEIPF